jgi:hypothetical protein
MIIPKEKLTSKEKRAVRMAVKATLRIRHAMPKWYYSSMLQGIQSVVYCLKSASWLERNEARFRKIDRILAKASKPEKNLRSSASIRG